MRPLRVAHFSTQTGWRGGEQQLAWLARGLQAAGHSCLVVCHRDGEMLKRAPGMGLSAVGVPIRGEVGIRAVRESAAALREFRPDMVHLHDAHAVLVGSLAAKLSRSPAVVASRRVDFRIHSRWKYTWGIDRVLAISAAVRSVLVECGLDPARIAVVPSGVDLSRFESLPDRAEARRGLGVADDELAVGMVAALTDHKGHRYLLEGWPAVLARHPRARLLLAGRGELEGELRAQAAQLGIAETVRFMGFCGDIPGMLAALDLFVLSSHLEGLCTSLMDAMAAQLPVVATEAGGIPEVVDPGRTGLLVGARDSAALGAAIVAMLDDSAGRARMGRAGREKALAEFGCERMVERTVMVYGQVLAAKGLL
ncbi:MAG TPA: glycosyltransferase [Planctomycetota bacterium]|nr:glycosyltransferase [Planctomycetota bacterium]